VKRGLATSLMVVLCPATVVVLAGCGTPPPPPGSTPASTPASTQASTTAPAEPVSFEIWTDPWDPYSQDWLNYWTDQFNQTHPNIQVTIQYVPGDTWNQKLTAAQAGGTAPEAYRVNYKDIPTDVSLGQLLPLDQYIDPATWSDVLPNISDAVSVGGQHYTVPFLIEPGNILYYNKDLFSAAGLDPSKPPTTWDELWTDCDALKASNADIYCYQVPTLEGDLAWTSVGQQMNAAGHLAVSDDWSKATVTDQGYQDFVSFYATLMSKGYAPEQALSDPFSIDPVAQANAAMLVTGSWGTQLIKNNYPDMMDHIGVGLMPTKTGDATKPVSTLGGWTYGIDANAKHPKEVAEFLTWIYLGDPKIMADFFQRSMYAKYTVRSSVQQTIAADPAAASDPWVNFISTNINPRGFMEPIYAWDIQTAVARAVERVWTEGQSVTDALAQASDEISQYIANNNYAGTNPRK